MAKGGDTGTEIVPAGAVEIIGPEQMEIVEAAIRGVEGAALEVVDPKAAADAIVARILDAATPADVFARQETSSARDELVGIPIEFTGVQWLNSKYEAGPGVYALAEGRRLDTGEKVLATTSSRNAMAQLYRCAALGGFPQTGMFVEGEPTAQGNKPMWIEPVGGHIIDDGGPEA